MILRYLVTALAFRVLLASGLAAGGEPGPEELPGALRPGPGETPGAFRPRPQEVLEFFEAKVRPLLAENCFGCHGEKRQRGGLRLDSRESVLKGADDGPVIVAGDPEKSLMIHAVRQDGEIKMPPKGKLPEESIEVLVAWVKLGAPWPEAQAPRGDGTPLGGAESGESSPAASVTAFARSHWAFQPIRDPPVPGPASPWASSPIDAFILAKLEENGLRPPEKADRRTLIRRAAFDLIGIPPSPEEVAAFVADESPRAFEELVDRLLASPQHGERWARYWLDVARYADTKGYVFEEERRFPFSYTYRDYVIRAFNEDLPYDRFIIEQIAADVLPVENDKLPAGNDKRSLAAMGFLTLGRRFLNNQPDIIDDRIDVVTRGLMGLTVTCARCHDHKFDPIPTADYYSLYGVFASASEAKDPPLIAPPEETDAYREYEKELKVREGALARFIEEKHSEMVSRLRQSAGDYLLRIAREPAPPSPEPSARELKVRNLAAGELNPIVLRRWREHLGETAKAHHRVWAPWHAFAAIPPAELAARGGETAARLVRNADPEKPLNPLAAKAFEGAPPASMEDVARRYGELFARAEAEWKKALEEEKTEKTAKTARALADPALEEVRLAIHAEGTPPSIPLAEAERHFDRAARGGLNGFRKKIEEWKVTSPGAPARAMSLEESGKPHVPRIFVRGNPQNPGMEVPRRFLEVLSGKERRPFQEGSGRLELARSIASPANPLTARVLVNRVWMHHFGAGLVRTPGDFGVRSDPPTHPELLDWLASRFIEDGWSLKKLHRRILLTSAYQARSDNDPECRRKDPENRLLWRANRRRLDFEALRDGLLAVSGALDRTAGGRPVHLMQEPYTGRRTVYGFIDRQNLPGVFRTFDFATPDAMSPQRYVTTVPQQALFLMNSPFVLGEARRFAARAREMASEPGRRVEAFYRLAYGRSPGEDETSRALRFVEGGGGGGTGEEAWARFAQALLMSNEFVFLD